MKDISYNGEYKMDKKIMKVIIKSTDEETFTGMLGQYQLDTAGEHRDKDGKIVTVAYVPEKKIEQLRKPGIEIEVVEDATQIGLKRQKEVSSVNRLAASEGPIKGLGKKE